MELGALLIKRENANELALPVFIWEVVEDKKNPSYIINSEKGHSRDAISEKLPESALLLPGHSNFKIHTKQELDAIYVQHQEEGYDIVSEFIQSSYDKNNITHSLLRNVGYGFLHVAHNFKFLESEYCKSAEEGIENDTYSLIKELPSEEKESERRIRNLLNFKYLLDLDFIPKRFVLLKVVTVLKEIVKENLPSDNEIFSNSLIEKLTLGKLITYYRDNRDLIKSVTINYSKKFPGDNKVFMQFTSMLNKFDEEMLMYKNVEEMQLRMEFQAALSGAKLPTGEDGTGIIMKFLEFDLGFWQRIILLDINNDVPVRKPYKGGFSESHNYLLLLPFFQWLAPHRFPSYEDKTVNAETYNKVIVERMKSFVEGKIS